MECGICSKALDYQHPGCCVVCARSALYTQRVDEATALLEREKLKKHVEAVSRGSDGSSILKGSQDSITIALGGSTGGVLVDHNECMKRVDFDRIRTEVDDTKNRIQDFKDRAQALRLQMDAMRRKNASVRTVITQKRNDLSSATHGLVERRGNEIDKVRRTISRSEFKTGKVHDETVMARASLCLEAASLRRLRRASKSKTRDGREVYYLGFHRIYEMRDLNSAPQEGLSASIENIARLVLQVATYLTVRLPAEIVLPHRDWPGLTIFSPASSFNGLDIPFPTHSSSGSSSTSPSASRVLPAKNLPRPRPLFIDRPLPQLFKQDPKAYNVFVEAFGLLAYDVAWLCRVQGSTADFLKLDEVCAIGRNLYDLLYEQTKTVLSPSTASRDDPPRSGTSTPSRAHASSPAVSTGTFGQRSHGTAQKFLASTHDPRGLRILTPSRLIDAIKSTLVSEMQSAEWEVLDEQEWNQMDDDIRDDPVVIGGKKRSNGGNGDGDGRGGLSTINEMTSH